MKDELGFRVELEPEIVREVVRPVDVDSPDREREQGKG